MDAVNLSQILGYARSPHWFAGTRLRNAAALDHSLSRTIHACRDHGGDLCGVYTLARERSNHVCARVVYLIDAPSVDAADRIHRKVWNQDVAPFILMSLPETARLYTGFRYGPVRKGVSDEQRGVLHAALAVDQIARALDDLRAERIDDGTLFHRRHALLSGEDRVDVRLLKNLRVLRQRLLEDSLPPHTAHALIGRFLYLRHLQDRGILDQRRIEKLGVDAGQAFGREASVRGFRRLVEAIDTWINGSVFPLPWSGPAAPQDRHVRTVASMFLGDDTASGQLHLDFQAYDFSYIPVETLSVIYEQFLTRLDEHREERRGRSKKRSDDGPTRREAGAFYSPLPLVDFVLDELEDVHPIKSTARVLDPACGSGAFLVQCYQRIIAQWRRENPDTSPTATVLRRLLTEQIFGIDRDEDACRVTEFSLILALLDHLPNADAALARDFKLPGLHEKNIFVGDFFDPTGAWRSARGDGFDWIVGNPPWVGMNVKGQEYARTWIEANEKERPVVDGRVSEAFAWAAMDHLRHGGRVGFVLPAMTLFAERKDFRRAFFSSAAVASITNLANLREVLFNRRARLPAAAFIYGSAFAAMNDSLCVYSPLLLNQAAAGEPRARRRPRLWTLTINAGEVRTLPRSDIIDGDALPWKLAMWGSPRDGRLLERITSHCDFTLSKYIAERGWAANTGLMLLQQGQSPRGYVFVPELEEKSAFEPTAVRKSAPRFALSDTALYRLPRSRAYVRGGRKAGLAICKGPHVVIDAASRFVVFCDEEIIVPHPHIGIAGPKEDRDLLVIISLVLSSRIARYHRFLVAPQEGIRSGRVTLQTLLSLPLPGELFEGTIRQELLALHDVLVKADRASTKTSGAVQRNHDEAPENRLEDLISRAYGLRTQERWLIDDLLDVKLHLIDGLTRSEAAGPPDGEALKNYADALRITLDAFFEGTPGPRHRVVVVHAHDTACVRVEHLREGEHDSVLVVPAEASIAQALQRVHDRVRRSYPQWVYFDRNLVLYESEAAYLFKPLQRYWWTRGRAMSDAETIIAETLATGGHA